MRLTPWFLAGVLSLTLWTSPLAAATPEWANSFQGEAWFAAWSATTHWGLKENCAAGDGVLRVRYPKGSASPAVTRATGAPVGGAQWLARPLPPQEELYLRYYVRFAPLFDFVKGGKLPGLFGGTEISGGRKPDGTNGFSTRYMWRAKGEGELYAYLFGGDDPYGTSIGRGTWRFQPGKWHCLEQYVRLNAPGLENGGLTVWVDGTKVIDERRILFRTVASLQIEGIFFSTFFGGNDLSWAATADSEIEFRDFALSLSYVDK